MKPAAGCARSSQSFFLARLPRKSAASCAIGCLVGLTIWAFSLVVIAQAQSNSQELHNASIAYVDEDHSELSRRIIRAFLPPYFQTPQPIAERDIIPLMNAGRYTFIIDIPPDFEHYVLGGRAPAIQVNVDATAMVQAGLGSGYAQQIITTEIQDFLSRKEGAPLPPVNIDVRVDVQSQYRRRHGSPASWASSTTSPCWHHSRGRRDRARTRAWHHGSSFGHAADAVRDRHVQGLGQ